MPLFGYVFVVLVTDSCFGYVLVTDPLFWLRFGYDFLVLVTKSLFGYFLHVLVTISLFWLFFVLVTALPGIFLVMLVLVTYVGG